MALVHNMFGDEGLREVLALTEIDQESLERDAKELEKAGLTRAAGIVMEAAETALPYNVLHCPYAKTDTHNYESWQASHQRRHSK